MVMNFFRNLFKPRRAEVAPEPQPLPEVPAEPVEPPRTPWQMLVEEELAHGNIDPQDVELLHDVELPETLDYDAVVANLHKKAKFGQLAAKTGADRIERNKAFETFLLKKFDKRTFKICERNGLIDQVVDEKNNIVTRPALVLSVGKAEPPVQLALECKWIGHRPENGLVCAGKTVLARAKVFERETKIPVFMLVGVAGTPDKPEHLFVIPLRDILSNHIASAGLMHYEKDVDEPFRFDRNCLKLY